jgi:rhodanese-related sulfurtransferase
MKYLFIDIRRSDEVFANRFGESNEYSVYNIPMNMIKFNQKTIIKHLEYIDEIYIVCRSAQRSQFIKDKYFSEHPKIKVNPDLQFLHLQHGTNTIKLNNDNMRIVQILLGTVILTLGGYTYYQIKNNKSNKINTLPLVVLLLFGLMALINGVTATCTLSKILVNYLN